MNILILGATGRVGTQILNLALSDQHSVTVLVRNPSKLQHKSDHLHIIEGNVLNPENLSHAVKDIDVVISTLSTDQSTVLSESAPLIIDAMKHEGVTRIISIGTAGILNSRTHSDLLRYESGESKRKLTRAAEEHRHFFTHLKSSGLDWTIVCPTYLPDSDYQGEYRILRDYLPENPSSISVKDTAAFAYSQINSNTYIHARVGLTY